MPDYPHIYAHHATDYDRLVSREDFRGNLFTVLTELAPQGGIAVDMGAGTGRMTRWLALLQQHVYAFDVSHHMLAEAHTQLVQSGMTNWSLATADNRALPLPNACADVVIEGWSFSNAVRPNPDTWRLEVGRMLAEMRRVLRPNGVMILLETLGTGVQQPAPPPHLAEMYQWWEAEHGLAHQWIRTDYQFETVQEAEELTRFFFGDALADTVAQKRLTIVPECTGVWCSKL